MQQEVSIHQSLNHKHIVQFFSYFEDENNVYIVLELCRRRVKSRIFLFLFNSNLCFIFFFKVINGITSTKKNSY
jgi:serine/threonine protein kinase